VDFLLFVLSIHINICTGRVAMPAISVPFDNLRREKLFTYPPKDKSAFPALQAAVLPHLESFNELFNGELLRLGCQDIGTKTVFDGSPDVSPLGNKLTSKFDRSNEIEI
jgi:hypothetical protein